MAADLLKDMAEEKGLKAAAYQDAHEAYKAALLAAEADDLIFVGGSIFLLSDLFESIRESK